MLSFFIESVNAATPIQQMMTQTNEPFWVQYMWPILAITAAPIASIKITQRFKMRTLKATGKKPVWWKLDAMAFISCALLAGFCWHMKWPEMEGVLIMAIMVPVLQTTIIKIIFAMVDKFASKEAAENFRDSLDITDLTTMSDKTKPKKK